MNLSRKSLTAVMLALIMMPAIYNIYFQVRSQLIRSKMWTKMMEGEGTDVVVIHPSKLYWMEVGREIHVNGLMFDVESIEKVGDSLKITGEYDYEESGLLEKKAALEEEHQNKDRKGTPMQMFVQVMDDCISRIHPSAFESDCSNPRILLNISALPTVYLNTISPPPKS
jgi:hypothetical protein